ncbi:MAG TPA: hypothetical protein VH394_29270 [Thermoanaerobaculia bacterium]|jgi:hypothetical protein|nr:hypothetical protein [Thermoanaerobaculia bacterium]
MIRNNLRQGMTALLFVAALMVAGARPAAAESLGWREAWDWLSGLFGRVTAQHLVSEDTVTVGPENPGGGPTSSGDCGLEIDPNGVPRCKPTSGATGG